MGALEVRLAESVADRNAAFALRYRVFCEELGARLPGADPERGIETDAYDSYCDHIIVCDTGHKTASGRAPVVGTYRALRPERVQTGYSSQAEFDIAPLLARHKDQRLCEVGRSCVAPAHRSRRTVEALWCGLWAYAAMFGIDTYFGTASFVGTDPNAHAEALAYLHHHHAAPIAWQVHAHPGRVVSMDRIAIEKINPHRALRTMPPLIRGYLRVNAHVGQTGYIDDHFGTIDVMVITRLSLTPLAYRQRFSRAINKRLRPRIQ